MKSTIKVGDVKDWKREVWEIQGLLYILASDIVVWRSETWGHIFFWYGVVCLVFGMLKITFSGTKESK